MKIQRLTVQLMQILEVEIQLNSRENKKMMTIVEMIDDDDHHST